MEFRCLLQHGGALKHEQKQADAKATHCLVPLTGNVQKRQLHRESRSEVTRGGRRTGNDRYHLKLDVVKSAELIEMTVNQDGPESQLSLCLKYGSAQNPPKSNT